MVYSTSVIQYVRLCINTRTEILAPVVLCRALDKPSRKWAWSRYVAHFKYLVLLRCLCNGLS